jgi:hypothetical protein
MTRDDEYLIAVTGDALRSRYTVTALPADMWSMLKDVDRADLKREVREAVRK